MNTLLSSTYRVERQWSRNGSWHYVPEHNGMTLTEARRAVRQGKSFEREGMRQRIVRTTERVVSESRSPRMSKRALERLSFIRGW